jgi:hypothetical protein
MPGPGTQTSEAVPTAATPKTYVAYIPPGITETDISTTTITVAEGGEVGTLYASAAAITTALPCAECEILRLELKKVSEDWRCIHEEQQLAIRTLEGSLEAERQRAEDAEERVEELKDILAEHARPRDSTGAGALGGVGVNFLPDQEISQRWNQLDWKIRQCVDKYAAPPRSLLKSSSQEDLFSGLRQLTPSYSVYLRDKGMCRRLAEAAIWSVLARDVFAKSHQTSWMFWAGKFSGTLRSIGEFGVFSLCSWGRLADKSDPIIGDDHFKAGKDDGAFHQWRVHTAAYLSAYADQNAERAHAETLVSKMEDMLKYVLMHGGREHPRVRLREIVIAAIQLDAELSQQRAWWYCHYPNTDQQNRYEIPFDPAAMKVPSHLEDAPNVAFMISPALVKAGDSRGENYSSCVVIQRSEVVCGLSRMPKSRPRAQSVGALTARPALPVLTAPELSPVSSVPLVVDARTQLARERHAAGLPTNMSAADQFTQNLRGARQADRKKVGGVRQFFLQNVGIISWILLFPDVVFYSLSPFSFFNVFLGCLYSIRLVVARISTSPDARNWVCQHGMP